MRLISTVSHCGALYLFFEDGSIFQMIVDHKNGVIFSKIADVPRTGSDLWRSNTKSTES